MNEALSAIRLIKSYAWEKPFEDRVKKVRNEEIVHLRRAAFLQSLSLAISPSITIIAFVATFISIT